MTPLYWPQVGRRMSDKGNVRRSFLWSDGPSVGGESDGEGHCRTADGGRLEVFSSFWNGPVFNALAEADNLVFQKR